MAEKMENRFFTPAEVGKWLGISRQCVESRMKQGTAPYEKKEGKNLIPGTYILEQMAIRKRGTTEEDAVQVEVFAKIQEASPENRPPRGCL